jgi:hypothetical protein
VRAVELGALDTDQVRPDVERGAHGQEQDLPLVAAPVAVTLGHELDQEHREGARGGDAARDRKVLGLHDVGVEEDEAAQEDLDCEDVADRDVDDPPEVGAQAERELAGRGRHVGPTQVQCQHQEPQDDERRADRSLDERLAGAEQTRYLVGRHWRSPPAIDCVAAGAGDRVGTGWTFSCGPRPATTVTLGQP